MILPSRKTRIISTIGPASESREVTEGPSSKHPEAYHRMEIIDLHETADGGKKDSGG